MLTPILIGLAVIILVFVVVVAAQPTDFRITRKALISATPSTVFAQVNDLPKWQEWSPWAKLDPNAKMTYQGPSSGPGAGYTWSGNNKVGEGRMTIMESRPSELVRLRLEFLRPFKATNTAEFTFRPEGGQTAVTWTMTGQNNFMGKAFGRFVNCDKMVGGDFEKGLAQLKSIAEVTANP